MLRREGRKEGGRERENEKEGFFSASDRSCSQMGGTGQTEGRLHQWRIEQAAASGESRCVDFDLRSPKTSEVFTFLIHVSLNICTTPTEMRLEFHPCCL